MKFSKLRQLFLVSSIGLIVAAFLTACQIVTVDYVFVASTSGIGTYAVDSESGAIREAQPLVTTDVSSPSSMALSGDFSNLYVANKGNNTIVHYAIALSGALAAKDTVTVPGTPVSIAVNAAGTYLYVVYSNAANSVSTASLASYSLSSGSIGSAVATMPMLIPGNESDSTVPTAVTVLGNNNAVYATVYDQSAYNPGGAAPSSAHPGWVFGFGVQSGGALSPLGAFQSGTQPSSIVTDPTFRFAYVTDFAANQLVGFTISSNGSLTFMLSGPFRTGSQPAAAAIDPRGKFLYVANSLDNSVSAYSIDLTTGSPTAAVNVSGNATNVTDTQPVAITVDPALGRFVYTANKLTNTVSGFKLDPTAGTLLPTITTPYDTGKAPTAIVAVPHGNHATQSIEP